MLAQVIDQALQRTLILDGPFAFVEVEFGTQDVAEQNITHVPVFRPGVPGPCTVQQSALQPAPCCRRCRLSGVVRLDRTHRNQRVRAGSQGIAHQEFQLAGLVAAARQSGQVIALDPELGSAQVCAEIGELMDRRG